MLSGLRPGWLRPARLRAGSSFICRAGWLRAAGSASRRSLVLSLKKEPKDRRTQRGQRPLADYAEQEGGSRRQHRARRKRRDAARRLAEQARKTALFRTPVPGARRRTASSSAVFRSAHFRRRFQRRDVILIPVCFSIRGWMRIESEKQEAKTASPARRFLLLTFGQPLAARCPCGCCQPHGYLSSAASCSRSAAIFASASACLARSLATTFSGADCTKRSLESFFMTEVRNPSQ